MTDFGRRVGIGTHAYTHHVGGTDLVEFPRLTARVHGGRHELLGDDIINVAGLSGKLADYQNSQWGWVAGKPSTYPPSAHRASHETGGADLIRFLQLTDRLHAAKHNSGGDDEITVPGYDGTPQSDDFSAIKEPLFWRHYTNQLDMNACYWDREVNAGFLTMYGGFKTNWSSGGNRLNFPYQMINGDFTVETKIILPASPSANYHEAGIILMRDGSNGIKFGRAYANGQILGLNHLIDAADNFVSISLSDDTLWLKVIRSGTAITCWYSLNGTDWTQKSDPGTTLQTAASLMVGPETLLGGTNHTWFVAKFEYFNFS